MKRANPAEIAARIAAHKRAALEPLDPLKRVHRDAATALWQQRHNGTSAAADLVKVKELQAARMPGFFPTPAPLCQEMIERAQLPHPLPAGFTALEPSAGNGNIADALRNVGIIPVCIEVNYTLAEILRTKGFDAVCTDFLTWSATTPDRFDLVIMNPPFEKGADITHTRRAYDLLKPEGTLIGIMSEGPFFRTDAASTDFRYWLDQIGGISERLPEGTFKTSGTGVNARIVEITR